MSVIPISVGSTATLVGRLVCSLILLCIFVAMSGCTSQVPVDSRNVLSQNQDLLSGELLFHEPVSADEAPLVDILAVVPAMQSFVSGHISDTRLSAVRFRRLLKKLENHDYFDGTYRVDQTYTARETFTMQSGNCLSYTNMFVALARAANLRATYQIVETPPTWEAGNGYLVRNNHINVIVSGANQGFGNPEEFTVDFNSVNPEGDYNRREVSDEYAFSLFYANHFVTELQRGNMRRAFAYLKRAILMSPTNLDLWVNLGAIYSKHGLPEPSLRAYRVAEAFDSNHKAVLAGIARTADKLGDNETAALYMARVRKYRVNNAYYHFAVAQSEYESGAFKAALSAINKALKLRTRSGKFHFMKGLVQIRLRDTDSAARSFRKAERYGSYERLLVRYLSELTPQPTRSTATKPLKNPAKVGAPAL